MSLVNLFFEFKIIFWEDALVYLNGAAGIS